MSLEKQKNLIIFGAVAAALLAGTVLVAGYTDMLPNRAKACDQVKPCQSGEGKVTCAGMAKMAGFPQVVASTEAAPGKPGGAGEKPAGCCPEPGVGCGGCEKRQGCCGEPCPPDCPKPCCAQEKPPTCCERPPVGGCCATKADPATE